MHKCQFFIGIVTVCVCPSYATRGSAMDPKNVPTIFGLATGEEKVNFPPSQAAESILVRSRSISLAFCAKTFVEMCALRKVDFYDSFG